MTAADPVTKTSQNQLQCVVVIQARRGSSRLPDKILKPLGGIPVLEHVLARCQAIKGVDRVICALPDDDYNDTVADMAERAGAGVFRGSEADVLARYMGAVENIDTQYVMRVTSDCPLLDPGVCGQLLAGVINKGVEYGATANWPHGLDCEVFTRQLLVDASREAKHPYDREHVTLWMKRHCIGNDFILTPDKNYMLENRWVLDYPEDYEFLSRLFELFPSQMAEGDWTDVLALVNRHPDLRSLNKRRITDWEHKTRKIYERVQSPE